MNELSTYQAYSLLYRSIVNTAGGHYNGTTNLVLLQRLVWFQIPMSCNFRRLKVLQKQHRCCNRQSMVQTTVGWVLVTQADCIAFEMSDLETEIYLHEIRVVREWILFRIPRQYTRTCNEHRMHRFASHTFT